MLGAARGGAGSASPPTTIATVRITAAISNGSMKSGEQRLRRPLRCCGMPAAAAGSARQRRLHAAPCTPISMSISTSITTATTIADREVAREAFAQRRDVDVEHHHHEQEQHHHRADVHQHQRDAEELGPQQQPQAGGGEEGQHQRAARRAPGSSRVITRAGGEHGDQGEGVEGERVRRSCMCRGLSGTPRRRRGARRFRPRSGRRSPAAAPW